MITLRKIMLLDVMKDARVLAGAGGLDREALSVSVLEIPKETPFIKKSELLITSMYSIYDDVTEQVNTVKMLRDVGASGLILTHVGIVMASVPPELIHICETYHFPLIIPPSDMAYSDLITPIMDLLLSRKNKELRQALKIHDIMAESVIDRQGSGDLLKSLQDILQCPVYYYDSKIQPVHCKESRNTDTTRSDVAVMVKENLGTLMNNRDIYIPDKNGNGRWLLSPVISSFKFYGVIAIYTQNVFSNLEWIAINQTKNFIAVVALNKINRNEYLQSQRKIFLTDLVSRVPVQRTGSIQKGRELGYDVESLRMAMVIGSENKEAADSIFTAVQKLNMGREKEYLVFQMEERTVLLLCKDRAAEANARKLGNYISNQILLYTGIETVIGIGRQCDDFIMLYRSYHEAETAFFLMPLVTNKQNCMHYGDVEIYDALLNNLDEDWGKRIVTEVLGPLIEYDNKNSAYLMDTLISLIRSQGNVSLACSTLYIHRNTMLQRKKKMIRILGEDPSEEENRSKYFLYILLYGYLKRKGNV